MKKNLLICILSMLITFPMWSQGVQWAYKVLEYSSQKGNKEYSAAQVLGKPTVVPVGNGNNVKCWQPKVNEKQSYIKVGFLNPIKARQIIIAESFNPGHISEVYVYDADGKEFEISNLQKKPTTPSRFVYVNTMVVNFHVFAVKIVLKHDDGEVGIDAIGISESDKPYKVKTNPNDVVKANMVMTRLSPEVNSEHPEMGPLVSPDGRTLYFSRRGDPLDAGGKKDMEDIWYSVWDDSLKKWGAAKNMGAPLNNEEPNFINSISPDGNTILLGNSYLPDGDMEDGVSISQRTASGWNVPRRLIIEDDRNHSKKANYFMSNSQKILLLSNERKDDTYGDRDLYVSFIKADTTWTKPLNLGKVINTKGTEAAPFLASDNKTLYYTSDGFDGYGGSDIYMSRRLDDTWLKWSVPENLGPVVNTSHNESYFTLNAAANKIYFTSQVDNNSEDVDMFMLTLPKSLMPLPVLLISGRVLNSKTKEPVAGVKILFENLASGVEMGVASSGYYDGYYQLVLPSGSNYGYLAQKDGYISVNSNIDLTSMADYKEIKKDLYITPIENDQAVILNNVFFVFDKYELRKESFLELDRLVVLLKNNSSMKIELSGNTDSIGTSGYNDQLSIKRATTVANYLITKSGIDNSRIILKHAGESNPVASNASAKGRQLNRRVECRILSK